jgi:transposase
MQNGKFILHHTKQKKGKSIYIYYMIAWYFRKNKKPFRNIIKHLGALDEYEVEFYKNSIACLNEDSDMFPCNINKVFVRNSNEYLSCALGIHFWDYWDLSSVFHDHSDQKEVKTSDIAKILTAIRWVQSCSKNFTSKLYQETCLPQLTGVSASLYNKTRIFRELENIENHREELGKHIFSLAKAKGYTQGDILFYDLSSGNISGLRCVMAKWGHCKDGYNTHVVLLLVITTEGYPVYWEILEGNTADSKTINGLISKIERIYGKIDSVLCFDRGMVSDENLNLLEGKNVRFITALDGNQVNYFKELIDFALIEKVKSLDLKKESKGINEHLLQSGFKFVQDNLFYKELQFSADQKAGIEKETAKLKLAKRRYFLAFNPDLAYLTHKHRKQRVIEYKEWIEEYNKELSQALSDRKKEVIEKNLKNEMKKRKIADVDIDYTLTEYKVENQNDKGKVKRASTYKVELADVTKESYEKAKKYDGLWVLITNISAEGDDKFFNKTKFDSYFEIYRLKNTIEEAFKILSSFVGIEPFYVYKTKHIQAHFTICVLSYLFDITILNKIRKTDKIDNIDLDNIFHILKKCKQDIIQLDERRVVSKITQVTEKQKKILDILDCTYLVLPEYLAAKDIISIEKPQRNIPSKGAISMG